MKIVLSFFTTITMVWCWWEVGHMMTAQVAKQVLLQKNILAYNWAEELVFALNDLTDGNSNSFVEAAVWADDIKETGTSYLNDWHYTDRPINNKGYNSIDAMKRAKSILTNPNYVGKITTAKAQMIRYVLHVIGDMHQPLHNTNFYNDTYKTGDLGGNLIKVKRLTGEQVNLHSYWDAGAFTLQPSDDYLVRPLNASAVTFMENLADTLIEKYPKSYFGKIDMTNPQVWSYEGYIIAKQYVYPGIDQDSQLTPEYQQQASDLVEKQIVLGGYRLAEYINDLFLMVQFNLKYGQEENIGFIQQQLENLKR